jgi:hypothetical protein
MQPYLVRGAKHGLGSVRSQRRASERGSKLVTRIVKQIVRQVGDSYVEQPQSGLKQMNNGEGIVVGWPGKVRGRRTGRTTDETLEQ